MRFGDTNPRLFPSQGVRLFQGHKQVSLVLESSCLIYFPGEVSSDSQASSAAQANNDGFPAGFVSVINIALAIAR